MALRLGALLAGLALASARPHYHSTTALSVDDQKQGSETRLEALEHLEEELERSVDEFVGDVELERSGKGLAKFKAAARAVQFVTRLKTLAGGKVEQSPVENDDLAKKAVHAYNAHTNEDIKYVELAHVATQSTAKLDYEFCIVATAGDKTFTFYLKTDDQLHVLASEGVGEPEYKCSIKGVESQDQSLERDRWAAEGRSWEASTVEELAHFDESFDARTEWPICRATIENVKNQGSCGSCYAFAATAAASIIKCVGAAPDLEGSQQVSPAQYEASQQQILDCARTTDDSVQGGSELMLCYGSDKGGGVGDGCQGGQEWAVMDYMQYTTTSRESEYKYVFGSGKAENHQDPGSKAPKQACKTDAGKKFLGEKKGPAVYNTQRISTERAMMAAIKTFGAITVSFDTYSDIYKMTKSDYGHGKWVKDVPEDMSNTVYHVKNPVGHLKGMDEKLTDDEDDRVRTCVLDDVVKEGGKVSCTTYQDCRDCAKTVAGRGGQVCKCAVLSGGHAAVAIGWGHQDDNGDGEIQPEEKYWLIRNSWGPEVGGEGTGIFKYVRGINFAGIEEEAGLAMPYDVRVNWEDAMFPKISRCLKVANGDNMEAKQDVDKCLVSNICDEWIVGRFVSGGSMYHAGSSEKPRSCTHSTTPPASSFEYLIKPKSGFFVIEVNNERFPLSRCSLVEQKKLGTTTPGAPWFDGAGKPMKDKKLYVGNAING